MLPVYTLQRNPYNLHDINTPYGQNGTTRRSIYYISQKWENEKTFHPRNLHITSPDLITYIFDFSKEMITIVHPSSRYVQT